MKNLTFILALLLSGCLSRTEVGALPVPDAGRNSSEDAGPVADQDAALSPEQRATSMFETQMHGIWRGDLAIFGGSIDAEFEFRPDSTYSMRVGNNASDHGFYFVTDRRANGRFAGLLQDAERQTTAKLDQMQTFTRDGVEVLSFDFVSVSVGGTGSFELTKVP